MKNTKDRQGIVMIGALAIMVILLSLGLTYMSLSRTEVQIAENEIEIVKSFYIAESGIEHAIAEIKAGNIPTSIMDDIDGDFMTDYSANINWVSNEIAAESIENIGGFKGKARAQAGFTSSLGYGAFMVAGAINTLAVNGTVDGNVYAGGSINPSVDSLLVDDPYVVVANSTGLVVPTPNFAEYANASNFANHTTLADCSSLGLTPPDGVYYITGNCTISAGNNPFTLNGTLVVMGDLYMDQVNGLTITPAGSDPAVVVNGQFSVISSSTVVFNGPIYVASDVVFTTHAFQTTIDGPLMVGGDLNLTNVQSWWMVNLDMAAVSPPFFNNLPADPTGGVTVSNWKGHQTL